MENSFRIHSCSLFSAPESEGVRLRVISVSDGVAAS